MVPTQSPFKGIGAKISVKEYRNLKDLTPDLSAKITSLILKSDYKSPLYQESFFISSFFTSFASDNSDFRILEFLEPALGGSNKTFAIFCIQIKKVKCTTFVTPAGVMFGYPGPIVIPGFEEKFLNELRGWANKNFNKFNVLVGHSPDLRNLGKIALEKQKKVIVGSFEDAPYIILDDYVSPLSKQLRTNLKTSENNLAKEGNIEFREHKADHPDLLNAVDRFISLHKNRWPNGRLAQDTKSYSKFYVELASAPKSGIRILELWSNNNLIASNFNFSDENRFYYFSPAFESKFNRFSPGNLMIKKHLEICMDEGLEIFDFMNDLEPYKLKWTRFSNTRWKIEIYSSFMHSSKFLESKRKISPSNLLKLLLSKDSRARFLRNPVEVIQSYFKR